jgi:hypothetical protein
VRAVSLMASRPATAIAGNASRISAKSGERRSPASQRAVTSTAASRQKKLARKAPRRPKRAAKGAINATMPTGYSPGTKGSGPSVKGWSFSTWNEPVSSQSRVSSRY